MKESFRVPWVKSYLSQSLHDEIEWLFFDMQNRVT